MQYYSTCAMHSLALLLIYQIDIIYRRALRRYAKFSMPMVRVRWLAEAVRGVSIFGTLPHSHLHVILPYSAYSRWPPSVAHRGSLVLHYNMLMRQEAFTGTRAAYLWINDRFTGLSVLTMGSPFTKLSPYDFLNLYEACLHACTKDPKNEVLDNLLHIYGS